MRSFYSEKNEGALTKQDLQRLQTANQQYQEEAKAMIGG